MRCYIKVKVAVETEFGNGSHVNGLVRRCRLTVSKLLLIGPVV